MKEFTQHTITRRRYIGAAGTGATLALAGCIGDGTDDDVEASDDFPEDDITLVVPYSTGGGYDTYARLIAPYLSDELGVNVNVENVDGAGGTIAANQVYNASAEGYEMITWNSMGFARNEILQDTEFATSEMTFYGQFAEDTQAIAVSPDTGIEDIDDFVEAVQNEELQFGTQGWLNDGIINTVLLGRNTGLYDEQKVLDNVVVYDGTSQAVNGMISGDVQVIGANVFSLLPYEEEGDVRLIAALRTLDEPPLSEDQAPYLQTLSQADVPEAESVEAMTTNIRAFAGPPDVPDEHVDVIADAVEIALDDEDLQAEAEDADNPITFRDQEETQQAVTDAYDLWDENQDLLETLQDAS